MKVDKVALQLARIMDLAADLNLQQAKVVESSVVATIKLNSCVTLLAASMCQTCQIDQTSPDLGKCLTEAQHRLMAVVKDFFSEHGKEGQNLVILTPDPGPG